MCGEHVHDWIPHLPYAEGFFSKRDDGQTPDIRWYTGRVMSCAHQPCETFLFIPNAPGLSPVECELATEAEEAVAA